MLSVILHKQKIIVMSTYQRCYGEFESGFMGEQQQLEFWRIAALAESRQWQY
jgi:hypothetical protein